VKTKLIKDPVHGYIELNEDELRIVDTAAFQRLRRVVQIPMAYLVYPSARHTRFEHSLGCFFLAKEFVRHLRLDEYRSRVITVSGLLHDVGHPPYSHLLETQLLENGITHEEMSSRILTQDTELASAVERYGVEVKDIVDVLSKKTVDSPIITGPMDVDKMDFLVRDSYFSGAMYGLIDTKRIIQLSEFVEGRLAVNMRGLGAIEEMAIARLQSFINVYFHHAVRAAQQLFLKAVRRLESELDFSRMEVDEYLEHDDLSVWSMLKNNPVTRETVRRIERRVLPKSVYETRLRSEKLPVTILRDKSIQQSVASKIASRSGVDVQRVWLDTPYVPPLPMDETSAVTFFSEEGGEMRIVSLDSPLLRQVAEVYNILRVYADVAEREKVARAAEEFFGEPTF